MICLGGRIEGLELAWDFVQAFLAAQFCHLTPLWCARGEVPEQTVSCADLTSNTKVLVTLFMAFGSGPAAPIS